MGPRTAPEFCGCSVGRDGTSSPSVGTAAAAPIELSLSLILEAAKIRCRCSGRSRVPPEVASTSQHSTLRLERARARSLHRSHSARGCRSVTHLSAKNRDAFTKRAEINAWRPPEHPHRPARLPVDQPPYFFLEISKPDFGFGDMPLFSSVKELAESKIRLTTGNPKAFADAGPGFPSCPVPRSRSRAHIPLVTK